MTEVRMRQASDADVDLITRLVAASFKEVAERFGINQINAPGHPAFVTAAAIGRTMDRGTLFAIADIEGDACGCVGIRPPNREVCAMEKLAVLPQWRRHGIGGWLVQETITRATALGALWLEAAIIADHSELKQWYQRRGFVRQGTERYEHLPFLVDFLYLQLRRNL